MPLSAYDLEVLADAPIAYWILDDAIGSTSCADSGGNGRHLDQVAGPPDFEEAGPPGVPGGGATGFSATATAQTDYLRVGHASWMEVSQCTLECWARFTPQSPSSYPGLICGKAANLSLGNYAVPYALFVRNGQVWGQIRTSNSGTFAIRVNSGTTRDDGLWRHYAITYDGATLLLYVDGAPVHSYPITGTIVFQSDPFGVGSTEFDQLQHGTVARVALFGGALSEARLRARIPSMRGAAVSVATAGGTLVTGESLAANALARATATGHMPTPGPGVGRYRSLRQFSRYGGASLVFWERVGHEDPGAMSGSAQVVSSATATVSGGALSGAAQASVAASGDLEASVPVAGASQAVASASGDLSSGLSVVGLAGDAVVRVAVVGDLNTGVIVAEQMSGSAQVRITATGDLQTNEIQGTAPVVSTATGQIGLRSPLSAEAVARAIAAGTPSVLVPLGGAAAVVEAATGALLARSGLAGSAADAASASAAMVAAMAANGSAASRAAAVASLMVGSSLAGQAAVVGTVTGAIGVGMDLDADARARASASATTGISTDLSGQARVATETAGTLRDVAAVTGGITYAVNLSTGAVTNLLNFDFERLVTAHGGALYGLKAGALYAVGGDADPGAAAIAAAIRFAPKRFSSQQHRLDKLYLATREVDGLSVTPIYDERTGVQYTTVPVSRDGLRTSKVNVGRNNRWHTLGLIVANRDGGKLDIGGIEFVVQAHHNRYK